MAPYQAILTKFLYAGRECGDGVEISVDLELEFATMQVAMESYDGSCCSPLAALLESCDLEPTSVLVDTSAVEPMPILVDIFVVESTPMLANTSAVLPARGGIVASTASDLDDVASRGVSEVVILDLVLASPTYTCFGLPTL